MADYLCKCGKRVKKSTDAGTTGIRDVPGCDGCPYRIPWTRVESVDGHGWESVVYGMECRASQNLNYQTTIQGSWDDKLTMSIYSLDLDFLERVSAWIKATYPGGELSGHFDRTTMRSAEFVPSGRYRMAISCAQNKKGLAAKAALSESFFDREAKTRKYVTAEAEKAKVLADIEAGCRTAAARAAEAARAAVEAQKKGSKMKEKIYQDPAGILYRVGVTGEMGNADRQHLTIQRLTTEPGSQWRKKPLANTWWPECRKEAQATLDTMAERAGWELADEDLAQYCALGRPALIGDIPAEPAPADGAEDAEEAAAAANLARFGFSPWTIHYLHAEALVDTPDELTELCDFELKAIEEACPKDWQKIKAFVDGVFDATDGPTTSTPIVSLQLPARAMIVLQREGIQTVEELQEKSTEDIMRMRDLGRKDYDAILQAIGRSPEDLGPAMYQDDAGTLYKVGVWEEGNSGDRYGVLKSSDNGKTWERSHGSPVHGPDVDQPLALLQLHLVRTAGQKGWKPYTAPASPKEEPAAQEYTPLPATMYSSVTGNSYKVGVFEEGNSGDRYGILVSRQGGKWAPWPNSPVHGPEVDHPEDLVQMALDQTAKKLGWDVYTDTTAPADAANPTCVQSSDASTAAEEQTAEGLGQLAADNSAGPAATEIAAPVPASDGAAAMAIGSLAFDYSGLDANTISVMHQAEKEIQQARQGYIIRVSAAVAAVHEELVTNCDGHNQHSDGTFIDWCRSVGLNKMAAYRFLQVDHLLNSASPEEAAQLEQASPSLLYAAAKPSAPAQLVQGVKDGDITTHKQYKQLEKELADAREALRQSEVGRNAAIKDVRQLEADLAQDRAETDKEIASLKQKHDEAFRAAHDFHVRAEKAEAERSALLDQQGEYIGKVQAMELELGSAKAATEKVKADAARMERMADDEIARMQQQVDDAEARTRQAEAALKGKPVEVVGAATEDIERWRAEGALEGRQQAEEARRALSDSLYAMAETIRENTLTQLNTWKTAARGLSEEDYVQCVSVLQPIQKKIMAMCAEHLPK